MHRSIRTAAVAAGLAAAGAALVATPALAGGAEVTREGGLLMRYTENLNGFAPLDEGAAARVQVVATASGRTVMTLHVSGLEGGRTFGAHAHAAPCTQGSGGGHFVGGRTTEPIEQREVWLDVSTDESGSGTATASRSWAISETHRPASVIVHAKPTDAAGLAGPKLGCLDITY